ncbi:MAG: PstS family phosphate ABC transporter substrate-binding protein [Janthinobacterium lividum]
MRNFFGPQGCYRWSAGLLALGLLLPGCGGNGQQDPTDNPTSGQVAIGVDETFAPIMQSQVDTFQKLYSDAHVRAKYQPEDSVFLDLLNDKSMVIVASRELNADEARELTKQKMFPKVTKIGIDGLAIVLNPANADSLLTLAQLHDIFSGKATKWSQLSGQKKLGDIRVVFDANRSSTSRFVRDSLLHGAPLATKAFATDSNPKLLDYVAAHPNAVGIIGVNWVSDFDDPKVQGFLRRVRVASIADRPNPTPDDFVQPYQANLAQKTAVQLREHPDLHNYPLRRFIYTISREPRPGLGTGFVSFVAGKKGQLIMQKSGLMPANVQARIVYVKQD